MKHLFDKERAAANEKERRGDIIMLMSINEQALRRRRRDAAQFMLEPILQSTCSVFEPVLCQQKTMKIGAAVRGLNRNTEGG